MNRIMTVVARCILAGVFCCMSLFSWQDDVKTESKPKLAPYAAGALKFQILSSALNEYDGLGGIAREIEIVDEQKKQISDAISSYMVDSRNALIDLNKLALSIRSGEVKKEKLKAGQAAYEKKMLELVRATELKIEKVLLPHQAKRLNEIVFQLNAIRIHNEDGAFAVMSIIKELDISEREKRKLDKKISGLKQEYEKERMELVEEYVGRISKIIPDSVKEKIRAKAGDIITN